MYTVTYTSGRIVQGIFASDEKGAISAAKWLHPNETVQDVTSEEQAERAKAWAAIVPASQVLPSVDAYTGRTIHKQTTEAYKP